jgi:hypothetical protein
MKTPSYLNLSQARKVLADIGIELNERQMKRAADIDATGKRKLPFFIDPIDKKLKIEKGVLLDIYNRIQKKAEPATLLQLTQLQLPPLSANCMARSSPPPMAAPTKPTSPVGSLYISGF